VFCVPGGSFLERLVRNYRPRALLGDTREKEIQLAIDLDPEWEFPLQVFQPEMAGCVETRLCPGPILGLLSAGGAPDIFRRGPFPPERKIG
jgi:hypothetical protein